MEDARGRSRQAVVTVEGGGTYHVHVTIRYGSGRRRPRYSAPQRRSRMRAAYRRRRK